MRKVVKVLAAIVLVAAVAIGVLTVFTPAEARGCICPLIYAPVECDHGRVYPNQCVADCHHAKNCVPIGLF